MENLTVISGSGERIALLLPAPELLQQKVAALRNALEETELSSRPRRIAELLRSLFPARCGIFLEELSSEDTAKLTDALACISRESGSEERICAAEIPFEESRNGGPGPASAESTQVSDEVIALCFCYKWTLEYAASLDVELQRRCLEIAGVRRKEKNPPAEEMTAVSAAEIARAVQRGKDALRRFREK